MFRAAQEALRNVARPRRRRATSTSASTATDSRAGLDGRRRRPRVPPEPRTPRGRRPPRPARCSPTWPRDAGGRLEVDSEPGARHRGPPGGAGRDDPRPARRRPRRRARRPRAAARRRRRHRGRRRGRATAPRPSSSRDEHAPDVVLMDLVDARASTASRRRARSSRPTPGARVVVLTSFSDRERILDALDAGAIGYLLKDAEPDELFRGIRAAAAASRRSTRRAARERAAARAPSRAATPALTEREREVLGARRARACRTS